MIEDIKNFFAELYADILEFLKELQEDTIQQIKDLSLDLFELFMQGAVVAISAIVPPEILSTSLDTISSGLHPSVHYFLQQSGFGQAFSIIGSAVMFRIARKIMSIGLF